MMRKIDCVVYAPSSDLHSQPHFSRVKELPMALQRLLGGGSEAADLRNSMERKAGMPRNSTLGFAWKTGFYSRFHRGRW